MTVTGTLSGRLWRLGAVLAATACAATAAPIMQYRFDTVGTEPTIPNLAGPEYVGRLEGGARVASVDGQAVAALTLDGQTGWVQIPGSAGLHLGPAGFTVVATVRFADAGTVEAQPETHDMILFKPGEYLFGRTGQRLYFNLHDGRAWAASVVGGACQAGVWTHAAAIIERIDEPPQGRVGYFVRLYLNGAMVATREILNCTGTTTDTPVNLGKGWGGPWFFRGDIAHLAVYPRPLSGGELNALLRDETLAPVVFKRTAAADPRFAPLLAEVRAAVAAAEAPRRLPLTRLVAAVEQAAHQVDTQAALLPFLASVQGLAAGAAADPLAEFARAHPEFTFLGHERLGVALFSPRPAAGALCSLFDLVSGREILGEQRALWALQYEPPGGGAARTVDSTAPTLVTALTTDRARGSATLEWTQAATAEYPFGFVARSELSLAGPRLALTLTVDNRSPEVALREVRFPVVRLRRLEQGTEQLLVPRMSGVLHPNPVKSHLSYAGQYPSGSAHLQFFAYYDDRGGVYVACEDGLARSKDLQALGEDNDCELSYLWYVGCRGVGGNGFASSGPAVLELFAGDWFDAAQIYKRFAQTAAWWPASRRRADTPDWYRNLTVWFIGNANTPKAAADLIAMRHDLGLPIGLHWYGWNTERFDDDYPHFSPREGFADTVAQLQAQGVYVKPYINARIWETRDRGDEDFQYTSVALPATVKDRQGQPVLEGYNQRSFAAMCPATPLWQKTMADLCAQVAGYGVAAIYLDQVSAGRPRLCFDPTHPHAAGAGEAWLEQGYWPMLAAIRRDLRQQHPDLVLNSEDAAEPYMHVLDGYLPWRFLDVGHVPAYQSIYAGRIQMTSRHFDDTTYDALFPKAAEQLLYGEQVGWFGLHPVTANPAFKVFVKKLAHTRRAFLPYFNEGDMLKPAAFAAAIPSVTADWGFYGPRLITTPALLHSAWRLGESVAVLFVNTTCTPVAAALAPSAADWGLKGDSLRLREYREGAAPTTLTWSPGQPGRVDVPGYGLAAWLITDAAAAEPAPAAQAEAVATLFLALRDFDLQAEMTPERKRAECDQRDPWTLPDTPVRAAEEWIPAATAAKLLQARVAPDGTYVGWIGSSSALCFGLVDFGSAAGSAVLECEVAVPPETTNGRIRFLEAVAGRGELLAEAKLESTGGWSNWATLRLPLPAGTAGRKGVVVRVTGRGSGICNVRRWRLVREP